MTSPQSTDIFSTPFLAWTKKFQRELFWAYQGPPSIPFRKTTRWCHSAWRIKKGSVQIITKEESLEIKAGQWVSMPPGIHFEQQFSETASIISIRFGCEWTIGYPLYSGQTVTLVPAAKFPLLDKLASSLIQRIPQDHATSAHYLEDTTMPLSDFLHIDSIFSEWLAHWVKALEHYGQRAREIPKIRPEIIRAHDYIQNLPLNALFQEADVADASGLSRSRLNTLYKETIGISPKKHFDQIRFEAAQIALELGDDQIKSIAFRLGFKSPTHFTVWFQRKSGFPPSAYKERLQIH